MHASIISVPSSVLRLENPFAPCRVFACRRLFGDLAAARAPRLCFVIAIRWKSISGPPAPVTAYPRNETVGAT